MPPVDWHVFGQLPGSVNTNFETLCRELIRRHYGRYGQFIALANQPGVEFHLNLHTSCALGNAKRWFGWQCRWYVLPNGKSLGSTRRKKIIDALHKTEKHLSGLTDWVLWTRYPLTKRDQAWFYALKTKMTLLLWSTVEVEGLLSGDAEILRGTYFGELVLTPDTLAELYKLSVAPIKRKWFPEVHQILESERMLRRILGETHTWDDLGRIANQLEAGVKCISSNLRTLSGKLKQHVAQMASFADEVAGALNVIYAALKRGDIDLLQQELSYGPPKIEPELRTLPHQLRARSHPTALAVTNVIAKINQARRRFEEVQSILGKRIVCVLADAGCGKTQLSCQLTASTDDRPPGILLRGKRLHAGHNLDSLAQEISMNGNPVHSMDGLLAALEAAGQRAHRRLPLVIDGLNEAEDPRNWKDLLSSLYEKLQSYSCVLVVCTLRTSFADTILPSDLERIEIPDFGRNTIDAIRRYFAFYKINLGDAELPRILSHPLTLRLFCEVTNPRREREVGIEAIPKSLAGLFEKYLEQAAERIAELAPITRRICQQDVRTALDKTGWALWQQKARGLAQEDLMNAVGDAGHLWNETIVCALEQEGILLREPGDTHNASRIAGVYDLLAGHLAAKAILSRYGRNGFEQWAKTPENIAALNFFQHESSHPLAYDVFLALIALVPRQLNGGQLWSMLDDPLRTFALNETAVLESAYLDAETVKALAAFVIKPSSRERDILDRLLQTRGAPDHPLNSKYFDTILRGMDMPNRDLRWSEWIRRHGDKLLDDVRWLEKRWQRIKERNNSDTLRALWVSWILATTVRNLRDEATRALYWFGLGDPAALYNMTIESLTINDPYIPERMLAASYGTAMALRSCHGKDEFVRNILPGFAVSLYQQVFDKDAPYSTTHALMRDFARYTIELALLYIPDLLNPKQRRRIRPPFKDGGIRKWGIIEDRNEGQYRGGNSLIGMDFGNYTIGRLVPDRGNYQFEHKGYKEVLGNIYWRIYQLGYSFEAFGEVDKTIASDYRPRIDENAGRIDRYGKKYSWIAYFELFGFRQDGDLLKSRYSSDEDKRPTDIDIDPSFPGNPSNLQIINADWLGNRSQSIAAWIERGKSPDIMPFLIVEKLEEMPGPWVLLDGYIIQADNKHLRELYSFARGLFVPNKHVKELRTLLAGKKLGRLSLPEVPEDYYTFSGEIPWCETFPENGLTSFEFQIGERKKRGPQIEFIKGLDDEELEKLVLQDNLPDTQPILKSPKLTFRLKTKSVTVPVMKSIPVLLPVRENTWENYHSGINPGQHARVPAREISEMFGLAICSSNWHFYDRQGNLAAISIDWGDQFENGQNLCLLRQDLLNEFLKRRKMSLMWSFWGGRELRVRGEEYQDAVKRLGVKHPWKKFWRVYLYDKGKIIKDKVVEGFD